MNTSYNCSSERFFFSFEREHKERFEEGDRSKMPLVVFGNGLKNKSHVKFKGLRHGASEKVYRQLRLREKLGELVLLDIDEYKTSKVKTHACEYHTSTNTVYI